MLRILLVTTRQATIRSFVDGLSSDRDVRIEQVASKSDALNAVRDNPPQLVIIDSSQDGDPLKLVSELLVVNAMVNTAVVSSLSEQEFHDASEGLGILGHLPLMPDERDAKDLLRKLKKILGVIA